jgi:CHRD domain
MRRHTLVSVALGTAMSMLISAHANATPFSAKLGGFSEVPSINSNGTGTLELDVGTAAITYTLSYSGLGSPVTQAHIHIGQEHTAGGIMVFLCSNLGNAPAGTPACPTGPGTVTGTIMAASVIGPAPQGVAAGDFNALVKAIANNAAYGNVHTTVFPGGEIRGQIQSGGTVTPPPSPWR